MRLDKRQALTNLCLANLGAGTLAFNIRAKRNSVDFRIENLAYERSKVIERNRVLW